MSIIHGYLVDNTQYLNKNNEKFPFKYLILEFKEDTLILEMFMKEIIISMGKRLFDYIVDEFLVIISLKHVYQKVEYIVMTNNDALIKDFDETKLPIYEELEKEPKYTVVGYNLDDQTLGSISSDVVEFKLSNLNCYFSKNQ